MNLVVVDNWDNIAELLGLLPKQMRQARRTATRKAGHWANREGSRGVAKAANVPLKILREGMRLTYEYKSLRGLPIGNLWVGMNAIATKYLAARQQRKGVKVRGVLKKGVFIAPSLGGHSFQRRGKKRVPIDRVDYQINERVEIFLDQFTPKVTEKFIDFFFAELDKISGMEAGEARAIVGGISKSL